MDDKVSKWAFESMLLRCDRTNRRMWILCIILIAITLATNIGWIVYESQWQAVESSSVTQDVQADGDGDMLVSGGDLSYGK